MAIPALTSTGFTAKEDSKYFNEEKVDPALRKEIEGGFVVTRARYTRAPVRVITTGFTDITDADKILLFNFYDAVRGGSASFAYTHPVSGESVNVRFKEPLKAKYVGMGPTKRWDIADIQLETI